VLDSNLLVNVSNMGAAKARAMKAGSGAFDIEDFVSKLITFMGGRRGNGPDDSDAEDDDDSDPLQWDKIGRKAMTQSRRIPVMDFMSVIYAFTVVRVANTSFA
jgi:non-structural maintenance of chromosomes element 4